MPVDPTISLPHHKHFNRIPCTFSPLDYVDRSLTEKSCGGHRGQSQSRGRRGKKNKGKRNQKRQPYSGVQQKRGRWNGRGRGKGGR